MSIIGDIKDKTDVEVGKTEDGLYRMSSFFSKRLDQIKAEGHLREAESEHMGFKQKDDYMSH